VALQVEPVWKEPDFGAGRNPLITAPYRKKVFAVKVFGSIDV
jgi:hypothetical protein